MDNASDTRSTPPRAKEVHSRCSRQRGKRTEYDEQSSTHQVGSGQVRSGQIRSGQIRSDQIRSDQIRSDPHFMTVHSSRSFSHSGRIRYRSMSTYDPHIAGGGAVQATSSTLRMCPTNTSDLSVLYRSCTAYHNGSLRYRSSICI